VRSRGVEALGVEIDVGRAVSVDALAAAAVERLGRCRPRLQQRRRRHAVRFLVRPGHDEHIPFGSARAAIATGSVAVLIGV
jgi:hypothetical protein